MKAAGGTETPKDVYVDAKILHVHEPDAQREAFVGYVVEGDGRRGARKVDRPPEGEDVLESDDVEILAILFAIEELRAELAEMTVVCDHESVVSEANRETVKNPTPLMKKLREVLRTNTGVKLRALQANPAHAVVTEYVNSLKDGDQR